VQQVLGRVGALVGPEQQRGLAGVDLEGLGPGGVLGAGAEEALDRRAVVGPVDPAVGGAELEAPELGLLLEQVERGVELLGVHAVAHRVGGGAHR